MAAPMEIEATGFTGGSAIPKKFTGDGQDVSPGVRWSGVPDRALALALLVEDPDARGEKPFVHWSLANIPPNAASLPEGVPRRDHVVPQPTLQGVNDFGKVGYGGPAPPPGSGTHHYHFHLYALDQRLDLESGYTPEQLRRSIRGHVLAEAETVGTYRR